jgi:hypothetical protein
MFKNNTLSRLALIPPGKLLTSSLLVLLLAACKHPLVIVGEGDIVDRNGSAYGCTLEQFNAADVVCTGFDFTEDYIVEYEAIARPGWQFVRWEGPCKPDSVAPYCSLAAPLNFSEAMDDLFPGVDMPATTAVFEPISAAPPVVGSWKLAPEAGALAVGPEAGSSAWWANGTGDVSARACLFDDEYVIDADGSFTNMLGADTWLEGWQGVAEGCGAPIFPHDASNSATWEYDETAGTIMLTGTGAFLGISKATNDGELANPGATPNTVTYKVTFADDNTMIVAIEAGSGVHWTYKLIKESVVEPEPASLVGTWSVAPQAGSLAIGPEAGSSAWWSNTADDVTIRSCLFDDEYVFDQNGSFNNVMGDDTWIEPFQGGSENCGTPVFPHDGTNAANWVYDENAGTLTLTGTGAYLGLAKVTNQGELATPDAAPNSITYNVTFQDSNTLIVAIEAGAGTHWTFKMVKDGGEGGGGGGGGEGEACAPVDGELAINGDFEMGDFSCWTQFPSGGTTQSIVVDDATSSNVAFLDIPAGAGPTNNVLKQQRAGEGSLSAGQTVNYSFDYRGTTGVGGLLAVKSICETSSDVCGALEAPVLFPGPTWTPGSGSYVLPAGVETYTLEFALICGGDAACEMELYLDNVTITVSP